MFKLRCNHKYNYFDDERNYYGSSGDGNYSYLITFMCKSCGKTKTIDSRKIIKLLRIYKEKYKKDLFMELCELNNKIYESKCLQIRINGEQFKSLCNYYNRKNICIEDIFMEV